jgi:RNA polymerase sigma-70 factor (ECF subfamily)
MTAESHATDEVLLAAYRERRDEAAFQLLVERSWARSYRTALAILRDPASAEDAAQQSFIRLLESARGGEVIGAVAGWLRRVVVNEARMLLRSSGRRSRREAGAPARAPGGLDPAVALRDYMDALPEKLRLPILLHYGFDYTHAEVGLALGCPAGTASTQIRTGLEKLRQRFAADGGTLPVASIGAFLAADFGAVRVAPVPRVGELVRRMSALRAPSLPARLASRVGAKSAWAGVAVAGVALAVLVLDPSGKAPAPAPAPSPVAARVAMDGDEPVAPPAAAPRTDPEPAPEPAPRGRVPVGDASRKPEAPARLTGRVVDTKGDPLSGARVTLALLVAGKSEIDLGGAAVERQDEAVWARTRDGSVADLGSSVSAADGRFSITLSRALPPVCDLSLTGRGDGAALSARMTWGALPDCKGPIEWGDVVARPLQRVSLLVRADQAPIEGATVLLDSTLEAGRASISEATDRNGLLEVETTASAVQLTVTKPDLATEHVAAKLGERVVVDLVPESLVSGHVFDVGGRPVRDARVLAYEGDPPSLTGETTTDAGGAYVLHGLRTGRAYQVSVVPRDGGLKGAALRVTAPSATADATLEGAGKVVVAVTRAKRPGLTPDGPGSTTIYFAPTDPIVFCLELRDAGGDWSKVAQWSPLAKIGPPDEGPAAATFDEVVPGTYRVIVHDVGLAPAMTDPFVVAGGAEPVRVSADLKAGRGARGRVVNRDGQPVAEAAITITVGKEKVEIGSTFEDGSFQVDELVPDDVVLEISKDGKTTTVTVGAAQKTVPDVVLPVKGSEPAPVERKFE